MSSQFSSYWNEVKLLQSLWRDQSGRPPLLRVRRTLQRDVSFRKDGTRHYIDVCDHGSWIMEFSWTRSLNFCFILFSQDPSDLRNTVVTQTVYTWLSVLVGWSRERKICCSFNYGQVYRRVSDRTPPPSTQALHIVTSNECKTEKKMQKEKTHLDWVRSLRVRNQNSSFLRRVYKGSYFFWPCLRVGVMSVSDICGQGYSSFIKCITTVYAFLSFVST